MLKKPYWRMAGISFIIMYGWHLTYNHECWECTVFPLETSKNSLHSPLLYLIRVKYNH